MKKLKNKVFFVTLMMLTRFMTSILIIFNYQYYGQRVEAVRSNLMRMDDDRGDKKADENIPPEGEISHEQDSKVFIDSTIYTIMLDSNLNITNIINHTTNNVSEDSIKEIANHIINSENRQDIKIGNLYFDNYSYSFSKNYNKLIIIDNTKNKEVLQQYIKTSAIIFVILEIIIIIVSNQITNWIITPVIDMFDKQKQFIADASHELKTPLAVIIASSEALENEPDESKWLDNIRSESERMNNLITNLLEMAKSENKLKETVVIENLSKLIEKSILTFESLIYEKNITLKYDIKPNINFLCDSEKIKQVMGILIDNAIQHSVQDGEITIKLFQEKRRIILTVANKGKEIPKEEREKIFERFYRADESRNRNENRYGLGLAIAKNIVENHNGKISAFSEKGYTTFKIIFKI